MAYVIHPDARVEEFKYTGIDSVDPWIKGAFTSVPGCVECGYLVLVDDEGLLTGLPLNPAVKELTQYYSVLVGPAIVVSFEEAHEEELMYRIRPDVRREFERRLHAIRTGGQDN